VNPPHDKRSKWSRAARGWFEALDHKVITVEGRSWIAQVVGIHGDLPHLWIQLEPANDSGRSLLLRVTLGTSVERALTAIAASTHDDGGSQRIECASATIRT